MKKATKRSRKRPALRGKVPAVQLYQEVAEHAGLSVTSVKRVMDSLTSVASSHLTKRQLVHIGTLGELYLTSSTKPVRRKLVQFNGKRKEVEIDRQLKVVFAKSPKLRRLLMEDEGMDKFAVDESVGSSEALEKRASKGCPVCGRQLAKHGSVLLCPVHGSEPLER